MRALLSIAALILLATSATAQTPDWGRAQRIEIDLSNFKFTPDSITLTHGQPYVLHFVNKAGGGHDFVAKAFFKGATIAASDRAVVQDGEIALEGHATADVRLIAPAVGTYEVHCSHFMHSTFGMKGKLVVQ